MPRMRGFLHSRPKTATDEWELVQARVDARLAALFRASGGTADAPPVDAAQDAADGTHAPSSTPLGPSGPSQWTGGPRPRIVVSGDSDVDGPADPPAADSREPTGVMTGSNGHGPSIWDDGPDSWRWAGGQPESSVAPEPVAEAETSDDAAADGPLPTAVAEPAHEADPVVAPEPLVAAEPAEHELYHASAPGPAASNGATHAPVAAPVPAHADRSRRPAAARSPVPRKATTAPPVLVAAAFCPYCALVLEPAPTTGRRCMRCQQRIMVKHLDGRTFYLTVAAVTVFDAEQKREADEARLGRERDRWLRLAATVGAPADRRERLAATRATDEVVAAVRALYQGTVDRAFRAAKHDRDWDTAARIRRENATLLYRIAGSPVPPPPDVVAFFREGVAAELHGIAEIARDAELVSAGCCDVCRADDKAIFRIAVQLRTPRLPHEGCPKGLCRCTWDLADRDRETLRRYLRRHAAAEPRAGADEPAEAVPAALS